MAFFLELIDPENTLNCRFANIFRTSVVGLLVCCMANLAYARSDANWQQQTPAADTTRPDTLRYPLRDRYADPYTAPNRNTFDLSDTAFIKKKC